jgi:Arc/MetJ family transcription regulator
MRTTITLDDELLAKASRLAGSLDRSALLREGLKAFIERESARRLAQLGGTEPALQAVPRRREADPVAKRPKTGKRGKAGTP